MSRKLRILFVVTEDWYFKSHRLDLAENAIKNGYEVGVVTKLSSFENEMKTRGLKVYNWNVNRSSKNLINSLKSIIELYYVFIKFKPDIIFSVAFKPIIFSNLAGKAAGMKKYVFTLGGLGIFSNKIREKKLFSFIFKMFLKVIFSSDRSILILQNKNDINIFQKEKLIDIKNIKLIEGAGVDLKKFTNKSNTSKKDLILLPTRLLWSKGIRDFIEVSKKIQEYNNGIIFALVGKPDKNNPDSVDEEFLKEYHSKKIIEWWGYKNDMPDVFNQSSIICYPSVYGEGVPKSLIEAASCGKPIVTYDIPGCNSIVKNGYNGFLVPPKNIDMLFEKIKQLIENKNLSEEMGNNGRKLVEKHFSQDIIFSKTNKVWESLLK